MRDLVISISATYGLYFIGSLMHFEPWHMITSFIQYMFFLPSCTFAFHPISCSRVDPSSLDRCEHPEYGLGDYISCSR